jgi:F-type H+-transporting ATPase subunit epsilon
MRLRIATPQHIVLDAEVRRVVAEAPNGFFGMLPNHVDFVSELVPGVLVYETEAGDHYAGIAAGTLVKCADEVRVAVRSAILEDDLGRLTQRVTEEILREDEDERAARSALARLEAEIVRHFLDLEKTA